MREWIDNGAGLAWLVDPERRVVEIYRPGRETETLVNPESISGEGPVEGFVLDLGLVWDPRPPRELQSRLCPGLPTPPDGVVPISHRRKMKGLVHAASAAFLFALAKRG